MHKKLLPFAYILIISSQAFAADPFLSDSEEDGTYAEEVSRTKDRAYQSLQYSGATAEQPAMEEQLKKQNSFNGSIESLLQTARPEPEEEKNAWLQFEQVEGTEAEAKFYETSEFRINSELSKPIETKAAFGDKLGNIEQRLGTSNQTSQAPEVLNDDFFNSGQ